ncbi:MAG: polysaccharide biosynthesis tyrosine autokinase [Candidatus Omnitrophica bacterium]|nr:polysaccharide biosynthesis tyrosine autokinase [Candidatus Omnitrophota bacterium]
MIPPAEVKVLGIKDYWEIFLKRKWLVVSFILITVSLVAFYDFTQPKKYRAEMTMHIEKQNPQIMSEKGGYAYQGEVRDREYYYSQYGLLKSLSLAERVIDKLDLANDPEIGGKRNPARVLLSWVDVKPERMSNLVIITVTGRDRLKITSIANTWAREFIYQDIERRTGIAKYGVSWLEGQLEEALKKIQQSDKELNNFVRKNKIVNIPDMEKEYDKSILRDLEKQKSDLENEVASLSKKYKGKHPEILALNEELNTVILTIKSETEKFMAIQDISAEYRILKRRVDSNKSIYENLLQRAKELDVSKELSISNIRIVDEADVPLSPVWPRPKRDIILALAMSIFLSLSFCFFLEYTDSTLKTSDDVEFYAKLPFLGAINLAKEEQTREKLNLLSHTQPFSIVAENFKNLRTALIFSFPEDKPLRTIVIGSTIPQEGKSFTSANLAIAFAQTGDSTLLIDADMRKGHLAKSFSPSSEIGLSSLLAGVASLEEVIVSTDVPNLDFIGCGHYTPNPTELLGSATLKDILREVEKKYKRVIIDSTPVLSVSEAILLADKCDGLVFVIRAGVTPLKHIAEARKILGNKTKIIGAVLNGIEQSKGGYYFYHYSYSPETKK